MLLDRLFRPRPAMAAGRALYALAVAQARTPGLYADLAVGRKMRKLGEAFYGRGKSYEAAFAALPDTDALEALLTRTVYADAEVHPVRKLVDYILAQRTTLADQPLERLLAGEVDWTPA